MRRTILTVFLALSVALLATGCDFFRVLAGRPTSKDIAQKRERIEREMAAQAVQDSVDAVAGRSQVSAPSDSAENEAVADQSQSAARPADSQVGSRTGEKKRYYVIMGAFSSRENAEKYASRIRDKGLEPVFFGFTEGRTAVGVGGTDDAAEAKAYMKELKGQDFCPDGVWILDRKKK